MGGSGGSSSGKVDYPDYMKTQHEAWLDDIADHVSTAASGDSPYTTYVAYDPANHVSAMDTAITSFNAIIAAFAPDSVMTKAIQDVLEIVTAIDSGDIVIDIATALDTYADILEDDLEQRVLPAFKRDMQTVGASIGSAFVIGEALLRQEVLRQTAKYQTDLDLKNADIKLQAAQLQQRRQEIAVQAASAIVQAEVSTLAHYASIAHYSIEKERLAVVMYKEEAESNLEYAVMDAKWDLSLYQEGANMMASIAGAATQQGGKGPSKMQSAAGGALAGAAAGAQIGGPVGAGVGAAVGLIGGLL